MRIRDRGLNTMAEWISNIKPTLRKQRGSIEEKADVLENITFCPFCGAVLATSLGSTGDCPACQKHIELKSGTAEADDPLIEASPSIRSSQSTEFEQAILSQAKEGYYVVRQTKNFVEMRKPKKFSRRWAAAWFIGTIPFVGLGVVGYAAWHVAKTEETILIVADQAGRATVERFNS